MVIESLPIFEDSATGKPFFLSASDIEVLRRNAITLDGLSYRTVAAFDYGDMAINHTIWHPASDYRLWRGGLILPTGATDLKIIGTTEGSETVELYVYLNGAYNSTIDLGAGFGGGWIPDGYWGHSIDVSAMSGALEIEIRTHNNTTKGFAVAIGGVWVEPVTITTSWPDVPTFSGVFSADLLNQLCAAEQWLSDRINAVPMVVQVGTIYMPMNYKAGIWDCRTETVTIAQTNDILRLVGWHYVTNPSSRLLVYVDGSLAYTGATRAPGTYVFYVPIAVASGTHQVRLCNQILTGNFTTYPDENDLRKRTHDMMQVQYIGTQASGSGYPVQTPPTATVYGTVSEATLRSRLNAVATMLSTIKSRIDATPAVWNRVYATTRRFSTDDHNYTKLAPTHPHTFVRRGARLVVRGKGVTIGFGGVSLKANDDGIVEYNKYEFAHKETAVDGETLDTKTIYLDSIAGLVVGTRYWLTGDVIAANEYLE